MNLDVVLIAIRRLNGADPRMLVGNVALGDPRQLHTPVDGYSRVVLPTGQQLVDFCPHDASGSSLERYAVQVWLSLHDRSLDRR